MRRNIRNFAAGVTLVIVAMVGSQSVLAEDIPADADADPGTQGEWSVPFDIGITAIHSVLLHNGKVLVWGDVLGRTGGNRTTLWDPSSGTLSRVTVPYPRNMFCAGEIHLADGRLMVIGGMRLNVVGEIGVKQTDFFDPTTETWSRGPLMNYSRWYPDVIEVSDGTILAIGGRHDDTHITTQVERYDPTANAFTRLGFYANTEKGEFPRTVVLPNGQVFTAGQNQDTNLLDLNTNRWSFVGNMNYGQRLDGMAVLLPGLNQVMAVGGGGAAGEGNNATSTAEIIDFSVPTPSWQYTASMNFPRGEANAVLLPDGTVLVVGGAQVDSHLQPVYAAELFDPLSQTWTVMASAQAAKAHHSTALLLPDGRVWSAGGDQYLPLQTSAQLYSPPYLFKGPRPVISQTPQNLTYNQPFSISTPDAANIARVALIKLGATTHAENFDQRYVDLAFQIVSGALNATSPGDSNQAPPGWYMLFIVTGDGIPSVASMVLLQ
jgi:hypothetical protein